jgi:hypothetical protein
MERIQAILLVESFKLVSRPPLDEEGSRPKSGKLRLNLHGICFGRKKNQLVQTKKIVLKGELLIRRTKNQARDQGTVQLKDSICVKSVQIGSYEIGPSTPSSKVGA